MLLCWNDITAWKTTTLAYCPIINVSNTCTTTTSVSNKISPSIITRATNSRRGKERMKVDAAKVWVETAEEGFVDEDENLMMGETCLVAVKAFASNVEDNNEKKRLLCAGALVQRPFSNVRDAWMADSFLDEPNIQIKGAIQILDHLFYHHLRTTNAQSLHESLSTFVVQSGRIDSEYHCSSYMAAVTRGLKPLKEVYYGSNDDHDNDDHDDDDDDTTHTKPDRSDHRGQSFHFKHLNYEDEDSDALVFDDDVDGIVEKYSLEMNGLDSDQQSKKDCEIVSTSTCTVVSIVNLLQKMNQTFLTESVLE